MRRIPEENKKAFRSDPWYSQCCLSPFNDGPHARKIDIHHNMIYAGQQTDDLWSHVPLCRICHEDISDSRVKEIVDWIMLTRAPDGRLRVLSKVLDYVKRKRYLINIYGDYYKILEERGELVPQHE